MTKVRVILVQTVIFQFTITLAIHLRTHYPFSHNYDGKRSGMETKKWECPSGLFVKKIQWDHRRNLKTGVGLGCYEPRSKIPNITIRTHGDGNLKEAHECLVIRALKVYTTAAKDIDYDIEPSCPQNGKMVYRPRMPEEHSFEIICPRNHAVTGYSADFNAESKTMSKTNIICSKVEKIEEFCTPWDEEKPLFTCDAASAIHPLKCTHTKTVGFGISKSMSEQHTTEMSFYVEFGFNAGFAALGLAGNFEAKVGISKTTGYNWGSTEESTFHEETTLSVEAIAHGGCVTQVIEIVGECAFMQVRPNYFKRVDKCKDKSFATVEKIPRDFLNRYSRRKRVYKSKIPRKVREYFRRWKFSNK